MKDDYPAFQKWYKILDWILDTCEKFPKNVRFTISTKISNLSIEILDGLISAIYKKEKKIHLIEINLTLEKLRIFMRLSHERKYLSNSQYHFISKELNLFGSMIGGWIKTCKE